MIKSLLLSIFTITLLSACSDPLDANISDRAKLTASEIEKIDKKLTPDDQTTFQKWRERTQSTETNGELPVATVRDAILNQKAFEKNKAAADAVQQMKDREAAERQLRAQAFAELQRAQQAAFVKEASQHLKIKLIDFAVNWPTNNTEADIKLTIRVKFTNNSKKDMAGSKFTVSISDPTQTPLGSYEIKSPILIKSGSEAIGNFTITPSRDGQNFFATNPSNMFFEFKFKRLFILTDNY